MKKLQNKILFENKFTAVFRIATGCLFIYSGISKAVSPVLFAEAITRYGILPQVIIPYIAIVLPFTELCCGLLLVAGFRTKAASLLTLLMLCAFTAGITWNYVLGRNFNCGCFSMNSTNIFSMIGLPIIMRNIALACLCVLYIATERHAFSLDNFFRRRALKGY